MEYYGYMIISNWDENCEDLDECSRVRNACEQIFRNSKQENAEDTRRGVNRCRLIEQNERSAFTNKRKEQFLCFVLFFFSCIEIIMKENIRLMELMTAKTYVNIIQWLTNHQYTQTHARHTHDISITFTHANISQFTHWTNTNINWIH